LLIDLHSRRVTRDGVELAVSGLTFDLLAALLHASPGLLSVNALMERVWPEVIVGMEAVSQRIKLLRQALGDDAQRPRYVMTLRGHGHRLMSVPVAVLPGPLREPSYTDTAPRLVVAPAPVSDAGTTSSESATLATSSVQPVGAQPRRLKTGIWLAIPLLPAALLLGASWWEFQQGLFHRSTEPATNSLGVEQSPATASKTSIAVLPFANLTGEPAKEYLGDGIAEELINVLARVPGLKVPARTSTFAYKGHPTDIRRIAKDLSVATILEGSVRSAGERLRISARLVDATSGFQIWSQDYDRQSADIFKLEDDLASQIVQSLRTHLNAELPAASPLRAPTQNVEAYQLYLRAQAAADGSPEGFLRGIALYDEALMRDPLFARALAGRSDMQTALVAIGRPLPEGLDNAERDAKQALFLDSSLASANAVLGTIYSLRDNWLKAESSFRAAIAADPGDGYIRSQYAAFVLSSTGHVRQAYSQASEAYRLAPANGFCAVALVLVSSLKGQQADADTLRFAHLAVKLGASPQQFAWFYAQVAARRGHYEEAAARLADGLSPAVRSAGGAKVVKLALDALGDPTKKSAARQALTDLTRQLDSAEIDPRFGPQIMYLFTLLDGRDQAFELMQRVNAETLSNGWVMAFWAPEMRPFREDRRFQALAQRLRLVEYWKQYGPPDECYLKNGALLCR
jgi:TolB-like protein/DNA-binding winged helix-turn-helix (wHTH) protein/Tfp pilus assembly protein PilF